MSSTFHSCCLRLFGGVKKLATAGSGCFGLFWIHMFAICSQSWHESLFRTLALYRSRSTAATIWRCSHEHPPILRPEAAFSAVRPLNQHVRLERTQLVPAFGVGRLKKAEAIEGVRMRRQSARQIIGFSSRPFVPLRAAGQVPVGWNSGPREVLHLRIW